ncbi:uncharacterized protein BO97DRAFT_475440 [Aspergillus homomorphus CBS 101889]|uniref:Uncharacterized protein n=1 Tax=Aspergillus homomorphus (strain CBS 101889) TaxID=1450537 RepID=A0A395I6K6_ASPHC|nr:hypothetical protein BO97DRAFT_475440 [Aspergillus homomorphus CBS 101889]RAL15790.1 hypothetical protein BO97DRAFT_475440 [Aspergillus homomorphus CBS 101889]
MATHILDMFDIRGEWRAIAISLFITILAFQFGFDSTYYSGILDMDPFTIAYGHQNRATDSYVLGSSIQSLHTSIINVGELVAATSLGLLLVERLLMTLRSTDDVACFPSLVCAVLFIVGGVGTASAKTMGLGRLIVAMVYIFMVAFNSGSGTGSVSGHIVNLDQPQPQQTDGHVDRRVGLVSAAGDCRSLPGGHAGDVRNKVPARKFKSYDIPQASRLVTLVNKKEARATEWRAFPEMAAVSGDAHIGPNAWQPISPPFSGIIVGKMSIHRYFLWLLLPDHRVLRHGIQGNGLGRTEQQPFFGRVIAALSLLSRATFSQRVRQTSYEVYPNDRVIFIHRARSLEYKKYEGAGLAGDQ